MADADSNIVHAADASLKECVRRTRYDNKDERISIRKKSSGTQALFDLVPPLNSVTSQIDSSSSRQPQ